MHPDERIASRSPPPAANRARTVHPRSPPHLLAVARNLPVRQRSHHGSGHSRSNADRIASDRGRLLRRKEEPETAPQRRHRNRDDVVATDHRIVLNPLAGPPAPRSTAPARCRNPTQVSITQLRDLRFDMLAQRAKFKNRAALEGFGVIVGLMTCIFDTRMKL